MLNDRNKLIVALASLLGVIYVLTLVPQNIVTLGINIFMLLLMLVVFMIVIVSRKQILNKGMVFIGFGYLFVFGFFLMYVLGYTLGEITNISQYDYSQLSVTGSLFELVVFIIGLTIFFDKPKIKIARFMRIEALIFILLLVSLLSFKIWPLLESDNTLLIHNIVNVVLIVGYLTSIIIIVVKRQKLNKDIYYLLGIFSLFIASLLLSLLNSSNEFIMISQITFKLSGVGVFVFYLYNKGLRHPFDMACKEVEETRDKLLELSRIDELTMIPNRRFLFESLEKSFRLAKREEHSIAFLMIDIDDFKMYNDNFGHLHGDSILRRIAKTVQKSCLRPLDFTGRYGGEEFLAILPNSDFKGTMVVANRILKEVRDLRIKHYQKQDRFLTVSIGFCVLVPDQNDTLDETISIADEYLYKVKSTGKNNVMGVEINKGDKEDE